jgi:hypothetical protein
MLKAPPDASPSWCAHNRGSLIVGDEPAAWKAGSSGTVGRQGTDLNREHLAPATGSTGFATKGASDIGYSPASAAPHRGHGWLDHIAVGSSQPPLRRPAQPGDWMQNS